jgi:DNA-binding NtrC family response regulator
MKKYALLLVDDDPFILTGVGRELAAEGYDITTVENGEKAVKLLAEENFDLVITDLVMEGTDGIQVLKKTKEINPQTMVIILTGFGDMTSAIDALRLDADDYMLKPCETDEMLFRIERCLEKLELKRKIKTYEKILPICCVCKNIRDDTGADPGEGEWMSVEKYMWKRAGVAPSSTYCSKCAQKVQDEIDNL